MRRFLYISFILVTVFSGCGSTSTNTDLVSPVADMSQGDEAAVTDQQLDIISNTNNDFAFGVYRYIENGYENNFISSYSLFTMLNMLIPGANGETKEEMLDVGNIRLSESTWNRYFSALNRKVIDFVDGNNSAFKLSFANSFWVQEGIDVDSMYVNTLQEDYGVDVQVVDFNQDSDKARDRINDWANQMTDGHIEEILSKESVNENSKIVLVNAMYLKALWSKSFFQHDTQMRPFYLNDGNTVSVPMMHQVDKFRHVKKDGVDLLCMQ